MAKILGAKRWREGGREGGEKREREGEREGERERWRSQSNRYVPLETFQACSNHVYMILVHTYVVCALCAFDLMYLRHAMKGL